MSLGVFELPYRSRNGLRIGVVIDDTNHCLGEVHFDDADEPYARRHLWTILRRKGLLTASREDTSSQPAA